MEKFHLISFETLCELPDEQGYLPCEISCVSYSLYAGIIDVYHQYVDPGRLPIGYRYLCQSKSKLFVSSGITLITIILTSEMLRFARQPS